VDYNKQMKVFITGGAGFIGSHLCDTLIAKGNQVTVLDNLSSGSKKNIVHLEGKIHVFEGDIRDKKLVESLVESSDIVLHMAAVLGVDNILGNPIESISTNFYGSEIVLNASLKYDKRVIIASTSEVYGKNPKQPLSEEDDRVIGTPQKLRWTYSDAKALEEATAYFLFKTRNLKVTTVRLFNTVGPRQTGKYGMVIPRFVQAALNNEPLNVFGDGTQSRVFCHVLDTVNCIESIIKEPKTIGEVFNIGGVEEISILALANTIKMQLKSDSPVTFLQYKEAYSFGFEDMLRRVPSIAKIKKYTSWSPKINLKKIIEDVANYYTHKNLGQP
jgi:UDP-glucose 4-epimerase